MSIPMTQTHNLTHFLHTEATDKGNPPNIQPESVQYRWHGVGCVRSGSVFKAQIQKLIVNYNSTYNLCSTLFIVGNSSLLFLNMKDRN